MLEPGPLLLIALCLGLALAWWRAHTRVGRQNRARQEEARRGEQEAERLLGRAGFRVVDRQVTGRWCMEVDGEPCEVSCRADLLVARRRRLYVAEVKTGERAPDPTLPATRRQLMEYLHAFDVDGVILVDMVSHRIRRVAFRGKTPT